MGGVATSENVTGPAKSDISAQNTHIQQITHILVTVCGKDVLSILSAF